MLIIHFMCDSSGDFESIFRVWWHHFYQLHLARSTTGHFHLSIIILGIALYLKSNCKPFYKACQFLWILQQVTHKTCLSISLRYKHKEQLTLPWVYYKAHLNTMLDTTPQLHQIYCFCDTQSSRTSVRDSLGDFESNLPAHSSEYEQ